MNLIVFKLAVGNLGREKARAFSAILGVAAATGLLAWHVGLAFTTFSQAETAVKNATEPYSAWITGPQRGMRPVPSLGETEKTSDGAVRARAEQARGFRRGGQMRAAPLPGDVFNAVTGSQIVSKWLELNVVSAVLDIRPGGHIVQGPPVMVSIATIPESGKEPFAANVLDAGRWPDIDSDEPEAAVSYAAFEQRDFQIPELGSELPLIVGGGTVKMKIVGFFRHNPLVSAFPSVYTSEAGFRAVSDSVYPIRAGHGNLLLCEIAAGHTPEELEMVLDTVFKSADECVFTTRKALEARFASDTAQNIKRQLPMSLSLAFITAVCMMVTVLTAGIAEQRRRIASMRCLGMTRGGAASMIACETFVITLSGWLLGLICSVALLQIFLLVENSPDLPKVISPGWQTPFYTLIMAMSAGMLATLAPAVHAMRVKPLEVIEGTDTRLRRVSFGRTLLGVILLVPIIIMGMPFGVEVKTLRLLMLVIGLPMFFAGAVLLAHPVMRLVEIIALPAVGAILGIDHRILSRRLSREPARAVGTIMTLSMGICSFMSVYIWGGTLMSSYIPSSEWPDVIVSALPGGLDDAQVAAAKELNCIRTPLLSLECSQFPFDDETVGLIKERGGSSLGQLLVFGSDPIAAFGSDEPVATFKFVDGDRLDAAAKMDTNNACVIPEMLSRITGLQKGDMISIAGKKLEIVGIVDLNWHMVTSRSLVRTQFGRLDRGRRGDRSQSVHHDSRAVNPVPRNTLGVIFTSEEFARSITGNEERTYFLWSNLNDELRAMHPLQATVRMDAELRSAAEIGTSVALRVHHRDEIADGTIAHGGDILGTMARIPFWSLVVTSSGIAALLIASARASRNEIKTMRAVGMTRSQLVRMFIGESILVVICTLALSFAGGIIIGWSFTEVTRISMSAGLPVKLVIPWLTISKGMLFAAVLCAGMTVLPLRKITQ